MSEAGRAPELSGRPRSNSLLKRCTSFRWVWVRGGWAGSRWDGVRCDGVGRGAECLCLCAPRGTREERESEGGAGEGRLAFKTSFGEHPPPARRRVANLVAAAGQTGARVGDASPGGLLAKLDRHPDPGPDGDKVKAVAESRCAPPPRRRRARGAGDGRGRRARATGAGAGGLDDATTLHTLTAWPHRLHPRDARGGGVFRGDPAQRLERPVTRPMRRACAAYRKRWRERSAKPPRRRRRPWRAGWTVGTGGGGGGCGRLWKKKTTQTVRSGSPIL